MRSTPDTAVYNMLEEDSPATRLRNLEAIGAYALNPQWEDGHHYGIYTWNYLRALCPCPLCRQESLDG
jgi:DUF971 family protein